MSDKAVETVMDQTTVATSASLIRTVPENGNEGRALRQYVTSKSVDPRDLVRAPDGFTATFTASSNPPADPERASVAHVKAFDGPNPEAGRNKCLIDVSTVLDPAADRTNVPAGVDLNTEQLVNVGFSCW